MRTLIAAASLTVGLALAGSAAAQSGPAPFPDQGTYLAMRKEAMRPTLDRLNRQDALVRLSAFSPEEIREIEEQTDLVLAATGVSCEVVEAVRVGQTVRRRDLFEVACANGYGYILMNGATPAAYDCWTLAQVGMAVRRQQRRADIGTQCGLERNVGDMADELLVEANSAR